MTTICGSCGSADEAGGTCSQCGRPLDAGPPHAAPPPPPPYSPAPQHGYGAPPLYGPQGGYPGIAPPRPPRFNPFLGWPVTDYLRDAGAAFCLFASLGMTWDASGDTGGEKWWVVISVLLSVASLALPYLLKANVIPGWGPLHDRLAKLAANVPFLASVVAALVNEAINVDSDRDGAVGVAVGTGLLGVTLALQPRQAEEPAHGPYVAPDDDRLWNRLAYGFGIAGVVVGVLMFAGTVVHFSDELFDEVLVFFTVLLVSVAMLLVMAAWPLAGYLAGSAAWRRVFATSTLTLVVVGLFAMADDGGALFYWPQAEKWYGDLVAPTGFAGTVVLGAAAGLSVCRSLARRPGEQVEPVTEWTRTASHALLVSAAGSVVSIVALVIGIVHDTDELAGAIVLTVLTAAVCACASAASVLAGNVRKNRIVVLALAGGVVVLGFVVMGVANDQDLNVENLFAGPSLPVTGWIVGAWLTLPALAAFALTVPRPVRSALGPLIPPQPAVGYPQQPPPPAPGTPPGPPPQPPYPGHPG